MFRLQDRGDLLPSSLDKSPDSLAAYLSSVGFEVKAFKSGDIRYRLRSPWNPDEHTPSAYIYASGILKDYSSGKSGNILTFKKMFGGKFSLSRDEWQAPAPTPKKPFNGAIPEYLLNVTPEEEAQIRAYASSRCITRNFLCGATKFGETRNLCMVFPHELNGVVVGAKFRSITAKKDKMRLRGAQGFYRLSTPNPQMGVYIEGEANANSLFEYYLALGLEVVVLSMGGVASVPPKNELNLPTRVIIDYDGDDAKYGTRILKWGHLGAPIKLRLPKGEDINSLYCKGKMDLITHLIV